MKKVIEANFYPVLSWHPRFPRKVDGKEVPQLEPELWEETNAWNGGVILWVVSPDRKVREPIHYKGMTAEKLEARIREILKEHAVPFVDPDAKE